MISGSFSGTGVSGSEHIHGDYALSLSGFGTATVQVQRSFDGGATWLIVEALTANVEKNGSCPARGVMHRLQCTAYTSGTIAYVMKGEDDPF